MKQDIDVTERAKKNLKEKFTYPAIFYYENKNGNIPFAVLLEDKKTAVRYTKNIKQDFAIGDDKSVIPTKKKKPELPMLFQCSNYLS